MSDIWEEEYSESEASGVADLHRMKNGVKKSNTTRFYDTESENNSEYLYHPENNEDPTLSDCTSSPLPIGKKVVRSYSGKSLEENAGGTAEDSDENCREVQCIEMEGSSRFKNFESHALSNGENEGTLALTYEDGDVTGQEMISTPVNGDREERRIQNGFTYGALEQRLNNVQKTIESLVSPYPDAGESSPRSLAEDMSSSRSLSLARSRSCRAKLMAGSSSPSLEKGEQIESTPPNGFEKNFPGRPEGFQKKLFSYGTNTSSLSRNDSLSSLESASIKTSADEDITSIQTFVAGLNKMAKNQVRTVQFICLY